MTIAPDAVRPADLALLDRHFAQYDVLSLDCFDTLLWRRGHAPSDVFAELPGGVSAQRMAAEAKARAMRGGGEVKLAEIYEQLHPLATSERRNQAMAQELAAEARHCFGFAPVAALLKRARVHGLRTMIVSDTYLDEAQLRALIAAAAGSEVAAAIDDIFCSSTFGVGKATGLFARILPRLGIAPARILHLGDNKIADHDAARLAGLHGVHLQQFEPLAARRLRLEAAAATLFDPSVRATTPAWQPHRPLVALTTGESAAARLGTHVVAPLLDTFVTWVRGEAAASGAKPIFLLRDGYLPARAHAALGGGKPITASLSRFTARRASFRASADIERYFAGERHERLEVHAHTLGLTPSETKAHATDLVALRRFARSDEGQKRIVTRSRSFATRLYRHLERQGVRRGDRVMFVDLGYHGSVQDLLTPVLTGEFGVEVSGRYLLLRENDGGGFDKRGLLDASWLDDRALLALTRSIAAVEQLCTNGLGSAIDYRDNGEVIGRKPKLARRQDAVRQAVQEAALGVLADKSLREGAFVTTDAAMNRTAALGILARLLFMPLAEEANLFGAWAHDVNLGTGDAHRLADRFATIAGLRREGMRTLADGQQLYRPAELVEQSFDLTLAHAAAVRHAIDLRDSDVQQGRRQVRVVFAGDGVQHVEDLDAWTTRDGFYRLLVPLAEAATHVGVMLGQIAQHIELGEASLVPLGEGVDGRQPCHLTLDGASELTRTLIACEPHALALVAVPATRGMALEIVFRPIGEPAPARLALAA